MFGQEEMGTVRRGIIRPVCIYFLVRVFAEECCFMLVNGFCSFFAFDLEWVY